MQSNLVNFDSIPCPGVECLALLFASDWNHRCHIYFVTRHFPGTGFIHGLASLWTRPECAPPSCEVVSNGCRRSIPHHNLTAHLYPYPCSSTDESHSARTPCRAVAPKSPDLPCSLRELCPSPRLVNFVFSRIRGRRTSLDWDRITELRTA